MVYSINSGAETDDSQIAVGVSLDFSTPNPPIPSKF